MRSITKHLKRLGNFAVTFFVPKVGMPVALYLGNEIYSYKGGSMKKFSLFIFALALIGFTAPSFADVSDYTVTSQGARGCSAFFSGSAEQADMSEGELGADTQEAADVEVAPDQE